MSCNPPAAPPRRSAPRQFDILTPVRRRLGPRPGVRLVGPNIIRGSVAEAGGGRALVARRAVF